VSQTETFVRPDKQDDMRGSPMRSGTVRVSQNNAERSERLAMCAVPRTQVPSHVRRCRMHLLASVKQCFAVGLVIKCRQV
jgi:hypothetical protein